MPDPKPKLLIVGSPSLSADELSRCLEQQFEVLIESPERASEKIEHGMVQAVLSSAKDLSEMHTHPAALLLNAIGEGVCLIGSQGDEIWANDRFHAMTDPIGQRLAACYEQARQAFAARRIHAEQHAHSAPKTDNPAQAVCKFELHDAEEQIYFEVYISTASSAAGGGSPDEGAMAVVVRDVSAQHRMSARMDAIDRAGAELIRLEAETVRTRNAVDRLKLLEDRIVKIAHEQLHIDHFVIRVLDERTGRLEPVIAAGLAYEAVGLELFAEQTGNGISGLVAVTGKSVICNDTTLDERFMPGLGNAQSSLTVPLQLHDHVLGIINIESDKSGAFSEEDRQFCEIFARYITIALHMLDLLVVESSTTNLSVSDRVESELTDCLEDIVVEAESLTGVAQKDSLAKTHISQIKDDVQRIRERVRNLASGPQTLLGIDRALAVCEEDPILKGRRVLVADDESKIRRIIRDVLRSRGCLVDIFKSGNDAIAQLQACEKHQVPPYDLVISDINMPDRNGYEVFNTTTRILPGVPVILMTGFGYDPHHSIVRASQEGLESVLFKPFQIERLIDDARTALSAHAEE